MKAYSIIVVALGIMMSVQLRAQPLDGSQMHSLNGSMTCRLHRDINLAMDTVPVRYAPKVSPNLRALAALLDSVAPLRSTEVTYDNVPADIDLRLSSEPVAYCSECRKSAIKECIHWIFQDKDKKDFMFEIDELTRISRMKH